MNRFATTAALLLSLLAGTAAAEAPNTLLVKLANPDGDVDAAVARIAEDRDTDLRLQRRSILGWVVLEVLDEPEPSRFVAELKEARSADVLDAAIERTFTTESTPNDPYVPQQWALDVLNLPQAWDTTQGSPSVTVAIVDSGIVYHEDLDGIVVGGFDFISDAGMADDGDGRDSDPFDHGGQPMDCGDQTKSSGYHGTMVSGVVAAQSDNGVGVAGAASGVKLTAVRALGACGGSTMDIAEAAWWAAGGEVPGVPANPNPAQVVNLSLGGPGQCDGPFRDVFQSLDASGIISVVAAGNDAQDTAYTSPVNCPASSAWPPPTRPTTWPATRTTGPRSTCSPPVATCPTTAPRSPAC